jgi:hypothetical protein
MHFDRHAPKALIAACLILLGGGVFFQMAVKQLSIVLQKESVPLREELSTIARNLGDWRKIGKDQIASAEIVEELGTSDYLSRTYARQGPTGPEYVHVHLAYYTGFIDTVPHVPDRCFEAGGLSKQTLPTNYAFDIDQSNWRRDPDPDHRSRDGEPYRLVVVRHPVTGQPAPVRMPLGEPRIRVTTFRDPLEQGVVVIAGYLFVANGEMIPTPHGVQAIAFEKRTRHAYYCKVQFTMSGDDQLTEARFLDAVSDLAADLFPELMRCLPDWALVEPAGPSVTQEQETQ